MKTRNGIEVAASIFFSAAGQAPIGIVYGHNEHGEERCFIGSSYVGDNEEIDIDYIACWGAKFPLEAARVLFAIKK